MSWTERACFFVGALAGIAVTAVAIAQRERELMR